MASTRPESIAGTRLSPTLTSLTELGRDAGALEDRGQIGVLVGDAGVADASCRAAARAS